MTLLHTIRALLKQIRIYQFIRKIVFFGVRCWYHIRAWFQKQFCKTAAIVLYHRIAGVSHDPTLLCVTPQTFEKHLQYYKEKYTILTLSALIEKISSKTLNGDELAITFDDGYQDNIVHALPLLEHYNVPATVFITTCNLGKVADFEWDKNYKQEDRARFLTAEEIRTLSKHPLITIGAHTVNHIKLSTATNETVRYELSESKKQLESITDTPVNFFAYPFGGSLDFTSRTETLTKEAGFLASVANNQLFATNNARLTAIPRINVRDYTIKKLAAILN